MNMKENLINKIKLMMSYDMGKTLIENNNNLRKNISMNSLRVNQDFGFNKIIPISG